MWQTIRDRIRTRMGELGVSAVHVSLEAGLSRSLLGKFLRGAVGEMREANLEAVARALGCTMAYLRGETDLPGERPVGDAVPLPPAGVAPVMSLEAVGTDRARIHVEGTVSFDAALAIMDLFRKGLAG